MSLAERIRPRHLALVGPTASGKSLLALELARAAGGSVELVSVDSMQVYRGLNIGTSKPTPSEQSEAPHHLIDVADPSERYTVARFRSQALAVLDAIESRGHTAILVGGTGLYLQAVIGDLEPPGEWPAIRDLLAAEPDTTALHARLRALDPVAAGRMEPSNRRRVLRALEVTVGSGRRFSDYGPGVGAYPNPARVSLTGVWLPRAVVAERIERRVAEMMEAGFLAEVQALAARAGGLGATARQALGYRELLAHVEHDVPLADMVEATMRRTRAFSVRQRRWFRRDPRIRWYAADRNPVALLPALLRELRRCHH